MWPHGPVCPHCGSLEKLGKIEGKSARPGLYWCGNCKSQFTVTVGTIFERSKVPLSIWLFAIHLLASSKKGMSANQLSRMLGVTVQTAWFMGHRIRERCGTTHLAQWAALAVLLKSTRPSLAAKRNARPAAAWPQELVLTLVERGGPARSFHVESTKKADILPIVRKNLARESHVMTDEARGIRKLGCEFAEHDIVDHSRGEYGYTDRKTDGRSTPTPLKATTRFSSAA